VVVTGGGFADNTNVQLATCDTASDQIFDAFPTSNGYYAFRRLNSATMTYGCLDVYGGVTATGDSVNVDQWTCNYATNEQWLPQ
jgi:hypothetical protein